MSSDLDNALTDRIVLTSKGDATCSFKVHAKGATPGLFGILQKPGATGDFSYLGASNILHIEGDWYQVNGVAVDCTTVELVGANDIDECATANGVTGTGDPDYCNVDTKKATCTNKLGQKHVCACRTDNNYLKMGSTCHPEPEVLAVADQKYVLDLTHTDRLDYGWEIEQIIFYDDQNCANEITITGTTAHAHYPGATADEFAITKVDAEAGTWRSQSLTCDPRTQVIKIGRAHV